MKVIICTTSRVSIRGVKSLGGHFACLCREFDFCEINKNIIIFQKEKGNTFTLLIIFVVKSLQKSKIAQIYYYDPQSAGINLQSPRSDSTPWTLTLQNVHTLNLVFAYYLKTGAYLGLSSWKYLFY